MLCSSLDQLTDAVEVAAAIDRYFDLAAEKLGYRRDEPVEVWLDPEWSRHATTFERCIVLNPSGRRIEVVDWILAHELVHWHADGTPLQRHLPHVIYEGLAERVAVDLVPRWEDDRRSLYERLIGLARERGELSALIVRAGMDKYEWVSLPSDDGLYELYALGFTLVDRIGVDALRDAAERGPVTLGAVLEMAGVAADGTGL